MVYLGIDIGGTSAKVAAVRDGRTLWTAQSPPYRQPDTAQLIQAIRVALDGRRYEVAAVGLCVPGLIDPRKRTTCAVNVPGLNGIALDELVCDALGVGSMRVQLLSDAVATGFDLYAKRKLAGRLLSLAIGTGVGAAVLDDGVPLKVDGESPGHFGQLDVSIEGHPVVGPDGGAGSLEGYLGGPVLAAQHDDVPAAIAAWRGDELPLRALARAIRIAHAIYRPHHVYLAGGIGIRLGHVLGGLRRLVEDRLSRIARTDWTLGVGDSEFHAVEGAARYAASNP